MGEPPRVEEAVALGLRLTVVGFKAQGSRLGSAFTVVMENILLAERKRERSSPATRSSLLQA